MTSMFVGLVIILLAAFIQSSIISRMLRIIKSSSKELYEEITEGYDEGWTKPIEFADSWSDRHMMKRLNHAIVNRRCMEYMSKTLYWAYRITNWILFPVPYLLFIFGVFFFYVFIRGLIEGVPRT